MGLATDGRHAFQRRERNCGIERGHERVGRFPEPGVGRRCNNFYPRHVAVTYPGADSYANTDADADTNGNSDANSCSKSDPVGNADPDTDPNPYPNGDACSDTHHGIAGSRLSHNACRTSRHQAKG